MLKYPVPNTSWKMFYQSTNPLPEPLGTAMHSSIFDYLASVSENVLPSFVDENLAIIFAPFIECPVSFPKDNLIFLHLQEPNECSQVIYQLGHELLHAYYKSQCDTPMFWFEEVLCEVSSHIFLHGFANNWNNSSAPFVSSFSDFALEYSNSQLKESEPVNLKQLPLDYLQNNPTGNRKINTYIASIMLPVFQKRPDFLAECRKLSILYRETSLVDFFSKAKNVISADYQLDLAKIEALFI